MFVPHENGVISLVSAVCLSGRTHLVCLTVLNWTGWEIQTWFWLFLYMLRGRVPFYFMWGDLDWLLTGVLMMVVPRVTQKQERRLIGTNDPVLALSSDLFDTLHLTPSAGVTRRNVACLKLATFFLSYTFNMIRQHRNTLQWGKVLKLPRMRGNSDTEWGAMVTLAGLIGANLHLYQNKYHCLINQTNKPN